jgi:hypothetical protein
MSLFDDQIAQASKGLVAAQERYIQSAADMLGLTVPELAERYYLEVEGPDLQIKEPDVSDPWDSMTVRFVERFRLRRRDEEKAAIGTKRENVEPSDG